MRNESRWTVGWMLVGALAAFGAAGCGKAPAEDRAATVATAPRQESAAADANREAELNAREQALAAKEAELARAQQEKEAELARARDKAELARARQEAELAKREAALARQAAASAAAKSAVASTDSPPETQPVANPNPITVPAGTRLSVSLAADLSTKTAKVGDPVQARLSSDVIVDGRTAVASGTVLHGTVTEVVSGSHKIGGVPTLGLAFDSIDLGNGKTVSIAGHVVQKGKSETAKDTGTIVGGAAAGAIIGHQVGAKKGEVIGGLLGGAAGTAAAQKTGGEVTMAAGSVLVFATETPFQVSDS